MNKIFIAITFVFILAVTDVFSIRNPVTINKQDEAKAVGNFSNYHPIHISIYKFVYRPQKRSIQLTMRFFIDDLQEAWVKEKHFLKSDYYDIDDKRAHKSVIKIMEKYLPNHLKVYTDNKQKQLDVLDFEVKGDVLQFYVRISQSSDFSTFRVDCDFLLDYFETQENIIFLKKDTFKESVRLYRNKKEDVINCK